MDGDDMEGVSSIAGSDQKLSSITGIVSRDSMSSHFIFLLSPTVTDEKSLEVVHADVESISLKLKLAASDSVMMLELESERLIFGFVTLLEFKFSNLFFKLVCHTFFISLSVLPGNFAAIADHLKIRINTVNIIFEKLLHEIRVHFVYCSESVNNKH